MGILRIFPHFKIFLFQCFQSSAFLRISTISSFPDFLHSIQREREMREKNAYKITLTVTERNAEKLLTKKKSLTVCTFILLTSGVLDGNKLVM